MCFKNRIFGDHCHLTAHTCKPIAMEEGYFLFICVYIQGHEEQHEVGLFWALSACENSPHSFSSLT